MRGGIRETEFGINVSKVKSDQMNGAPSRHFSLCAKSAIDTPLRLGSVARGRDYGTLSEEDRRRTDDFVGKNKLSDGTERTENLLWCARVRAIVIGVWTVKLLLSLLFRVLIQIHWFPSGAH
jgi:hypothetical protein